MAWCSGGGDSALGVDSDVRAPVERKNEWPNRYWADGPLSGKKDREKKEGRKEINGLRPFFLLLSSSALFLFPQKLEREKRRKNKIEAMFYFSTKIFCNINFSNNF